MSHKLWVTIDQADDISSTSKSKFLRSENSNGPLLHMIVSRPIIINDRKKFRSILIW